MADTLETPGAMCILSFVFCRPCFAYLNDDAFCSERRGRGQWGLGGAWAPTQLPQVRIQWVVVVVFEKVPCLLRSYPM